MSFLLLSEPHDLKRSVRICLLLSLFVSILVHYQSVSRDLASTFCLNREELAVARDNELFKLCKAESVLGYKKNIF